jgi:hypothetical protein
MFSHLFRDPSLRCGGRHSWLFLDEIPLASFPVKLHFKSFSEKKETHIYKMSEIQRFFR